MKQAITILMIIVAVSLLCGLGFWQLNRAQQKKTLIEHYAARQQQVPLDQHQIAQLFNTDNPLQFRYSPVKLQGIAMNDAPILLDNVIQQGQVGYRLYTPVMLDDSHVVLVERQFIPMGQSRQQLPQAIPNLPNTPITGYLEVVYRNSWLRSAFESEQIQWPLRVQTLDITLLSQILGKTIYPLLITTEVPTTKMFPISPEKHVGYAVQWFGLALTLIIVSLCYRRKYPNS